MIMKRTIASISMLLGMVFLAGCSQQSTSQIQPSTDSSITYSSEKYSLKYPKGYSVTETGKENTYILTVSKGDTTKLEIFKANEYPVDRAAVGFSGEETAAEADAYMEVVKANSAKEYWQVPLS